MLELHKKHSLGGRAFVIFFLRRIKIPIVLFVVAFAAWYAKGWVPAAGVAAPWADFAVKLLFLVAAAYTVLIFLLTYVTYRAYTYAFGEEAFLVGSGLATRQEVAALYHQIQNVNIDRSPLDRMFGVSQVVIVMTGMDRESGHAKLVLPAVGRTKARVVQKELLVRARKHVPPSPQRAE